MEKNISGRQSLPTFRFQWTRAEGDTPIISSKPKRIIAFEREPGSNPLRAAMNCHSILQFVADE